MITTSKTQLLATKILPPRCAPGLIDRPRLLDLVAQVETKQVAVIKAGPGFGKTSLAVAWAERLQQSGKLIAWLALDAADDEPTRFLFYVSHALGRASGGVGKAALDFISDISLVPCYTIVSTWINDLVDVDDDVYLFLDDYHRITDHDIHNAISYLLRYAPTQFHLVLTATGEPSLPLGRLRAHNQLLEIDTAALRFDVKETRRFLEQENIAGLDPSGVRLLHAKTEGWPAVLRIVASTLCQPGQEFARYVRGLSGALRPIGAYLAEMLDGLPHDMVQFMLRIAILDRFSASLCQAVTGSRASRHLLDSMETSQILLASLDQERHWYRYHPLLGGHLRQRLEAELGDEMPKLHRRAYRWYAYHELWSDAVRHAIAAGDADEAMSWVERCAMEVVKKGDLLTLLGWQRLFPTELMRSQIKVGLAIAWGLALAMRFEEALELLAKVEREVGIADTHDADAMNCECETIRSVVAALRDDSQAALPVAEACIRRSTDPWTANVASNVALFGQWKAGNLESFYATPWIPYSADEDRRNVFASVYRRCLQGLVEFQQLRLSAAERCYADAAQLAERYAGPNTAAAALPASLLARIRYEQGRVDEAEAMVIDRSPIIDATGMLECVLSAYVVLVDTAVQRRNIERAYALLEQLENLGQVRKWGRVVAAALAVKVRLYLTEGRITEGSACLNRLERLAEEYAAPTQCAWSDIRTYTLLARAFLGSAENHLQDTIAIFRALHQEAEAANNHYFALRLATFLSEALLSADEPGEAAHVFQEVLSLAAPAGLYQSILDGGPEVGTLLLRFQENARRTGVSGELLPYVDNLIIGWRELYQPDLTANPALKVVESLSPRERNILERIGQGQSNKEIARELGISPETVKTHIKNIFVKLAVEKRAQAVSRAQSLGLVRTQ
jgi:LuxR family transcriptional regulator, maltose regulon positive regulatory protein